MDYLSIYRRSLENPDEFWADAASQLEWSKPWDKVLDESAAPFYEWFAGGEINTCYNALDRHCDEGRAEQAAL
ncbi:MAG: propionyl-CoA synthetase, partial [Gammaproteobacteria bacterium]|nr:propionyl-CoA synthetase [Gammaproteobacteria bacterium]